MLKTGAEHLASLRDGRVVYIGAEKVDDVTTHPAFRNGARSMAAIYDLKRADPALQLRGGWRALQQLFPESEDAARISRSEPQLHRAIAAMSHGLLGRSPDHVSSFVTGMAMNASVFKGVREKPAELLRAHAARGHLQRLRRDSAAGGAQPGVLRQAEHAGADAARGARGRRRRGDLGHEDARHRRGVRQRDLDRQPDPAGAEPAGRVDHLRHRRSTRRASRSGRASRSSATRRASSRTRSPGASTRPTRW